jgi:hypothetical protein
MCQGATNQVILRLIPECFLPEQFFPSTSEPPSAFSSSEFQGYLTISKPSQKLKNLQDKNLNRQIVFYGPEYTSLTFLHTVHTDVKILLFFSVFILPIPSKAWTNTDLNR